MKPYQYNNKIKLKSFLQTATITFLLSGVLFLVGCKKYVEVESIADNQLSNQVFANEAGANSAITGIYRTLRDNIAGNVFNLTIQTGLSGDELVSFFPGPPYEDYQKNTIQATDYYLPWSFFYKCIYQANAAIEGLEASNSISSSSKNQYIGEAKFLRAFCYFYLTNLFGNIPLLTSTNFNVNELASRSSASDVYQQIIDDLKDAQQELVSSYTYGGGEKVRADSWVATAFLARVYLYQKDWIDAESQANMVINSGNYSLLPTPQGVFIKNNNEAILQLSNTSSDIISEPSNFIFSITPNIILTDELLSTFQSSDLRKQYWVQSSIYNGNPYYYPFKYSSTAINPPEYYTLFRLAEQYLIRAEARAQQNNIPDAISDLNIIRSRANLPVLSTTIDQSDCIDSILQERRLELFAETGHRWFDLKRTGRIDSVMLIAKPGQWKSSDAFWPIPLTDIQRDPNLKQNAGY